MMDQVCMSACERHCAGFNHLRAGIAKAISSGVKVIGAAHLLADKLDNVVLWLVDAAP